MPGGARIEPVTLGEFQAAVVKYKWTRKISEVHLHHTWRPSRAGWRGEPTIRAMHRFHTKEQGWSDIAQHATIDPFGILWLGRAWNNPPASAKGFNGNGVKGPFMFEVIGDFDEGKDLFDGEQRESAIAAVSMIQLRFGLPTTALKFHREMTDQKTCPGSGVDKEVFLRDLEKYREGLA